MFSQKYRFIFLAKISLSWGKKSLEAHRSVVCPVLIALENGLTNLQPAIREKISAVNPESFTGLGKFYDFFPLTQQRKG